MSSKERSSKDELRGQFSDLQKRLFSKKPQHNALKESNQPILTPLPLQSSSPDRNLSIEPLDDQENNLGVFLPPTKRTASGSLSSTGSKSKRLDLSQSHNSSLSMGPQSKGDDMNFVVGLSENLLTECRRLNAENSKLKSKLKGATEDIQSFKDEILELKNHNKIYNSNELELKEKNWQLENQLINLNEEFSSLNNDHDNLKIIKSELVTKINTLSKEHDDIEQTNNSLITKIENTEKNYKRQISELNERINGLNDENDSLHGKLYGDKSVSIIQGDSTTSETSNANDSTIDDESIDFDSLLKDINTHEIPDTATLDHESEVDTLRSLLQHSNKSIVKLRSKILNLKKQEIANKSKTSSTSSISQRTPINSSIIKRTMVKSNRKQSKRNSLISPLKKDSTFSIYNDNDKSDFEKFSNADEEWENFLGENIQHPTSNKSSPNKRGANDVLKYFETEDDTTIENDASILDESYVESPIKSKQGQRQEDISQSKFNTELTTDQLEKIAERKGLHLMTNLEYQNLVDSQKSNKDKLDKNAKLLELNKVAGSINHTVIPTSDYNSLIESSNNPSFEHLASKAETFNSKLIKKDVLKNLEEPNKHQVTNYAKRLGLRVLTESELNAFKNPTKVEIEQKANKLGLKILSESEFQSLKNPNHSQIKTQAKRLDFELVSTSDLMVLKNPDQAKVKELASKYNLLAIPSEEYHQTKKQMENPSIEYLKKHLSTHEFAVIENDKLNNLIQKVEKPTIVDLKASCEKMDMVVLNKNEYKILKEDSVHNQSVDQLSKVIAGKDHVTISQDVYTQLKNPSQKELVKLGQAMKLKVLPAEDFNNITTELNSVKSKLENPDMNELKLQAKKYDQVLCSDAAMKKLESLAYSPDLSHLIELLKTHGYTHIKESELQELQRFKLAPSEKELKEKASNLGFELINNDDLMELKKQLNEPTLDYLSSNLEKHDYTAISKDEINKLRNPTLDEIKTQASNHDHDIILNNEWASLRSIKEQYDSPTIEYLQSKSKVLEHCLISKDQCQQFDKLKNPSIEEIIATGKKHNLAVLSQDEYNLIQQQITSPSIEYLKEKASISNLALIKDEELNKIKELAHNPSIDHLQTHADKNDYKFILNKRYDELVQTVDKPTIDFLSDAAIKNNHTLISTESFNDLKSKAEIPDLEKLHSLAAANQYVLVTNKEYAELKQITDSPTLDYLTGVSKNLGYELIMHEELAQLKDQANSKNIEHITKLANNAGYDIFETEQLRTLQNTMEAPSVEFIKSKASNLDLVVADKSEYEKLIEPSEFNIKQAAEKLDLHVCSVSEFKELKHKLENPDLSYLKEFASQHESSLIKDTDLKDLKAKAYEPSVDHIKEMSKKHDHIILPIADYEALSQLAENPSEAQIRKSAKSKGFELISEDELKEYLQPPKHMIQKHASFLNSSIVLNEELQRLKDIENKPSLDFIKLKAANADHMLLTSAEHAELVVKANDPTKDHITQHAERIGLVTLSKDEYKKLNDNIENPTAEYIKEKASAKGYEIIEKSKLENLKDNLDNPSSTYLNEKAKIYNSSLVDDDLYKELSNIVKNPTLNMLEEKAKVYNCQIIKAEELEELKSYKNKPTKENVEAAAKSINMIVLDQSEFKKLKESLDSPTIEYITDNANKLNYSVVETTEYNKLVTLINSPSKEHIEEQAQSVGLVILPKIDYEKLLSKIENPTVKQLGTSAEKFNMQLIGTSELGVLKNQVDKPSLDHLKMKAKSHKMELVKSDEILSLKEQIEKPSDRYLADKASSIDHTLIGNAELEQLKTNVENPSIEYLKIKAASKNYKVIDDAKFTKMEETINSPSLEFLKANANKSHMVVISDEEYQSLSEPNEDLLNTNASKLGFALVKKPELLQLKKKLEMPNIEYLEEKSNALDYKVISNTAFANLRSQIDQPTNEYLIEKSALGGFKLIKDDIYKTLKDEAETPSKDHIIDKSNRLNLKVLEVKEYEEMIHKINKPSLKELQEKSKIYGHVTIPIAELEKLQHYQQTPITEIAKSQKMVAIPDQEYLDLQQKSSRSLEEFAETSGKIVVSPSLFQELKVKSTKSIEEHAKEKNKVLLSPEEYSALKQKESRSLEDVAKESNMVVISPIELTNLKIEAGKSLTERAKESNMALLTNDEYDELNSLIKNPNLSTLKESAKNQNYELISIEELESLKSLADQSFESKAAGDGYTVVEITNLRQLDAESAIASGYFVIPTSSYQNFVKFLKSPFEISIGLEEIILSPKSRFIELTETEKSPSLEFITSKAEALNHVVVAENDYSMYVSNFHDPEISFLEEKAAKNNNKIISLPEFDSLLNKLKSSESEKETASCQILNLKNQLSQAQTEKQGELEFVNNQMTKLEKEKEEAIKELDIVKKTLQNPQFSYIQDKANEHESVVIDESKYNELILKATESLDDKATAAGFVLVESSRYNSMNEDLTKLQNDYQKSINLRSKLEVSNIELQNSNSNLTENLNNPSLNYLNSKAELFDSKVVVMSFFNNLEAIVADPTNEQITEIAESLGLKVLPSDDLLKLNANANKSLLQKAEEQQMKILPIQEFESLMNNYQSLEQDNSNLSKKINNPDLIFLQEHCEKMGQLMLNKDLVHVIKGDCENSEIPSKAENVLLSKANYDNLNRSDLETIQSRAKALSHDIIPAKELETFNEMIKKLHASTNEAPAADLSSDKDQDITETSDSRDGVTVLDQILTEKKLLSSKQVGSENTILSLNEQIEELKRELNDSAYTANVEKSPHGEKLLSIPEDQYVATTTNPIPDVANVKVIPITYFNQLLKFKSTSIDKITREEFEKFALKKGFVPKEEVKQFTPPATVLENHETQTPPHKIISSTTAFAPTIQRGVPQSQSIRSNLSERSIAGASIRSNAVFSMATDVSFTDKSMIPAITQVVIGEYLFKYYRKFGSALSAIASTRHERYFWVHPYSLTLYWTENNPVLSSSTSSKTRAAAILGVESIDDNNPLPTGLYHKSIVVHSTDRSIKITCATRHRHNIWYNALRYLINRNIDELIVDEDENDNDFDRKNNHISDPHSPSTFHPPKSESHRNLESLLDTGDRRAYPRPKRKSSQQFLVTPPSTSSGRLSRMQSLRKND
ncbi:uncharacterized protein KGF55_001169 [Candida pseudojiufengensis]|uniref:uncharacterized protein n=1 Tax=Candida pseudojiufengensis TaxID=497109 RepID=UPI00222469C5|nr:uncharacterized protein KGF55_001169 [Candida pseudojiufengensis]KAI5965806.1 hypothetical protein KGF55_001169 [Candida pseudojiufengensis]